MLKLPPSSPDPSLNSEPEGPPLSRSTSPTPRNTPSIHSWPAFPLPSSPELSGAREDFHLTDDDIRGTDGNLYGDDGHLDEDYQSFFDDLDTAEQNNPFNL
jgi:hypothetical protein